MEGKKISFGFMKTRKANKTLAHKNDDKKDYIECVEEQSIKIVGGEYVPVNEPLVIPLKPNTLMKSDRLKEIALRVESALEEPSIKEEAIVDVAMADPLAENETLDQMAERELMQEANKKVVVENPTIAIPTSSKGIAEGENESTLDDYEAVPVQEFGAAMLRGMGWKPGQSRAPCPTERASHPSIRQVQFLLNFLEKNPSLARGFPKPPSQRVKVQREWERLTAMLNKRGGSSKTWRQWTKYWADKKSAIRKKVAKNNSGVRSDFMQLSDVEERIYALIATPLALCDKHLVAQPLQNQSVSQIQEPRETTEEPILLRVLNQPMSQIQEPRETTEEPILFTVLETQYNDEHNTTTQYNDSCNTTTQYNDQPRRIVVGPTETSVLLSVETQNNDQHNTTTQYNDQPRRIVVGPNETSVLLSVETQNNDQHNTTTQYNDQLRRIVVGQTETNVLLSMDKQGQSIPHEIPIPSLKGISPRTHPQNTSIKSHVRHTEPSSRRNSGRGRRSIIRTALATSRSSRRSSEFSKIAERFLKVEEQRLEHDRRTTNVLETVTRVVSRVLERDAENNRMMSQAMSSVGEGLKLLAEAIKSHSNES